MGVLRTMVPHPDELYPMVKLKLAVDRVKRQIPAEPHWPFCYSMLQKVSRSFALVIQQLRPELRNAVCVFYLVLSLDTVEDDTSIASDIKVPILQNFYCHVYDREWHFSCGTKDYKVLMDKFHLVSTAFLELDRSYQEAIEDITKRMGSGMAKFICKEVETADDYDEYCHYVAGLVGLGLSKLFHASGSENLASDELCNSMGLFLQRAVDSGRGEDVGYELTRRRIDAIQSACKSSGLLNKRSSYVQGSENHPTLLLIILVLLLGILLAYAYPKRF